MLRAYISNAIFNGESLLHQHAVLIEDGVVLDVMPVNQLPADILQKNYGENLIVPGFVDAQVYGAAGKLLSAYPEVETLTTMHSRFLAEGTVLFQPTVATNSPEVFVKSMEAVRKYKQQNRKGVHGIHLEGPWINMQKKGAHLEQFIHEPSLKEVEKLLSDYGDVISMITLAPECCSREVLQLLLHRNELKVSAGHSNASYSQAMTALDLGIPAITHLYNAMSALQHREPGLVGAAMKHTSVMGSIIPDGHHVHFTAISIAKQIMGDRLFAITDAVTETDIGPYQHQRAGEKYESDGILSGSSLSMHKAFVNLVQHVGLERTEGLRMCSLYPARLLGADHAYGRIAKGATGELVVLDNCDRLVEVIDE